MHLINIAAIPSAVLLIRQAVFTWVCYRWYESQVYVKTNQFILTRPYLLNNEEPFLSGRHSQKQGWHWYNLLLQLVTVYSSWGTPPGLKCSIGISGYIFFCSKKCSSFFMISGHIHTSYAWAYTLLKAIHPYIHPIAHGSAQLYRRCGLIRHSVLLQEGLQNYCKHSISWSSVPSFCAIPCFPPLLSPLLSVFNRLWQFAHKLHHTAWLQETSSHWRRFIHAV